MITISTAHRRNIRDAGFFDTFYWIALFYPDDSAHSAVTAFTRTLGTTTVVTTDKVLTEVLAACAADPFMRGKIAQGVRNLLVNPYVRVVSLGREGFLAGLKPYQSRADQDYSLVDCISMQLMRREGLTMR